MNYVFILIYKMKIYAYLLIYIFSFSFFTNRYIIHVYVCGSRAH